tara:strand:- start:492 stop:965 length:474 start_codon:yes stop_codon:yes gene_type:complete
MIYGHIANWREEQRLMKQLVLKEIFRWLITQPDTLDPGKFAVGDTGFNAIVMREEPVVPGMETFEAHRTNLDIHLCLKGAEVIRVALTTGLTIAKEYDAAKDAVLLTPPPADQYSTLLMTRGMFAILGPQDAHLPFHPAGEDSILKLVVKVPVSSLV